MATETENTQKEVLKHGEYKVKIKQLDKSNNIVTSERVVKPLNLDELAEGWLNVTFKKKDFISTASRRHFD